MLEMRRSLAVRRQVGAQSLSVWHRRRMAAGSRVVGHLASTGGGDGGRQEGLEEGAARPTWSAVFLQISHWHTGAVSCIVCEEVLQCCTAMLEQSRTGM